METLNDVKQQGPEDMGTQPRSKRLKTEGEGGLFSPHARRNSRANDLEFSLGKLKSKKAVRELITLL